MGISIGGGGGGSSEFNFKSIVMAMVIIFALPVLISVYAPQTPGEFADEIDELNAEYRSFVGHGPSKEAVWCLTGIYEPYSGNGFGFTADGWLYGSRVDEYSPSQLLDPRWESQSYKVVRDEQGVYRYSEDLEKQKIKAGDLYSSVMMDRSKISTTFFTESGKKTLDSGYFYYDYTGYRYAFAPLKGYTSLDAEGKEVQVASETSSLSLIWYQYAAATMSGIAGQLIVNAGNEGLAYITSNDIIKAFSETNSTAKFKMAFNGLTMTVYIRIPPYATDSGLSVAECYDLGLWSVMVTSASSDIDAYNSADSAFSVWQIWDTIVSLFTFNLDKYFTLSGWMAVLLPFIFMAIFYGTLLTIGLDNQIVLIIAGAVTVLQTIATALTHWGIL